MMDVSAIAGAWAAAAEPVAGPHAEATVDVARFERALAGPVDPTSEARAAALARIEAGRGTPGDRVLAGLDRPAGSGGSASAAASTASGDTPGARVLDSVDRSRRRPAPGEEAEPEATAAAAAEAGRTAYAAASAERGGATGQRSGLGWQTGFYNAEAGDYLRTLAADESRYLGRSTDAFTSFWNHESRETIRRSLGSSGGGNGMFLERFRGFAENEIWLVQAVPLGTSADRSRVNDILNGSLRDDYVQIWRDLGTAMARAGNERPIVRLGWEMNLASGGYAWNQSNSSVSPQQFVELYRLAADAIRSTKPDAILCWNPGKVTAGGNHIDEFYPGDDYVDIIGVDFYDNGSGGIPHLENNRLWDQYYMKTNDNGPVGIGAWYEYAKDKGRVLGVRRSPISVGGGTAGGAGRWGCGASGAGLRSTSRTA